MLPKKSEAGRWLKARRRLLSRVIVFSQKKESERRSLAREAVRVVASTSSARGLSACCVAVRAMTWANNALCAIASSMLTLFVTKAGPFHAANVNGKHLTTLGRPKRRARKAFMLSVGLKFTDNSSAETLLKAWGKAARYCIENEPFLFAYEVAQSDKDPLSYVILERREQIRLSWSAQALARIQGVPATDESTSGQRRGGRHR